MVIIVNRFVATMPLQCAPASRHDCIEEEESGEKVESEEMIEKKKDGLFSFKH